MKKRILALLLAVICVCSMFVMSACGEETDPNTLSTEANRAEPVTLTLCLVADEFTEAGVKAVQDALNAITKAELNTNVVLTVKTSAEYEAYVESAMAAAAAGTGVQIPGSAGNDLNEETFGVSKVLYPDLYDDQFDVLLVRGYESLVNLSSKLVVLNNHLNGDEKIITTFVDPLAMKAGMYNNKIYGVPNRHVFGEYTYLLLDAEVVKTVYGEDYDYNQINSLSTLAPYLFEAQTLKGNGDLSADTVILQNMPDQNYFQIDADILVGSSACFPTFDKTGYPTSSLTLPNSTPSSLLQNANYQDMVIYNALFEEFSMLVEGENGAELAVTETTNCAAAFVKGSYFSKEAYEAMGYYVVEYAKPIATKTTLSESMFAVSSYTVNEARAAELITMLATNADVCNVLAYGVEDVHYQLVEDEVGEIVHPIVEGEGAYDANNRYVGNLLYSGNQFLLKRSEQMDEETLRLAEDNWAKACEQNMAMTFNPYEFFTLKTTNTYKIKETNTSVTVAEALEVLRTISAEIQTNIDGFDAFTGFQVLENPESAGNPAEEIWRDATLEEYVAAFRAFLATEQQALFDAEFLYEAMTSTASTYRAFGAAGQYANWFNAAMK